MDFSDISASTRIPMLLEMVSSLSRASAPNEILEICVGGLRRILGSRCYLEISTRGLLHGRYRITRLLTRDGVDHVESRRWLNVETLPAQSGGCLAEVVATPVAKMARDVQLADDSALGARLADYHSLIAVPIFTEGAASDWVILLDVSADGFALEDLEELILRANLVGAAANNLQFARQLLAANLRIQEEVEHIAAIQRALLPPDLPMVPGLEIAASYETFEQAGGDMYDVCPLGGRPECRTPDPQDRWALLIGDVSGHGPSAAVVMAMVHSALHTYPLCPAGPAELLSHINRHLCARSVGDGFVTAFLAFYTPATRELHWSRAGHPPPVLVSPQGHQAMLDGGGEPPLGVDVEMQYTDRALQLVAGQGLLLYTDGVTDARNPGGEWFGVEGIQKAIAAADDSPGQLIAAVADAVRQHEGDVAPQDDQTLLAIRVTP